MSAAQCSTSLRFVTFFVRPFTARGARTRVLITAKRDLACLMYFPTFPFLRTFRTSRFIIAYTHFIVLLTRVDGVEYYESVNAVDSRSVKKSLGVKSASQSFICLSVCICLSVGLSGY